MQAVIRYPISVGAAHPGARSSDPRSSFKAKERAEKSGLVKTHCDAILDVLEASGQPMTAHEIGRRCGLSNVQVLRRTKSLVSGGKLLEDDAGHVCSVTGWRLKTFQFGERAGAGR